MCLCPPALVNKYRWSAVPHVTHTFLVNGNTETADETHRTHLYLNLNFEHLAKMMLLYVFLPSFFLTTTSLSGIPADIYGWREGWMWRHPIVEPLKLNQAYFKIHGYEILWDEVKRYRRNNMLKTKFFQFLKFSPQNLTWAYSIYQKLLQYGSMHGNQNSKNPNIFAPCISNGYETHES